MSFPRKALGPPKAYESIDLRIYLSSSSLCFSKKLCSLSFFLTFLQRVAAISAIVGSPPIISKMFTAQTSRRFLSKTQITSLITESSRFLSFKTFCMQFLNASTWKSLRCSLQCACFKSFLSISLAELSVFSLIFPFLEGSPSSKLKKSLSFSHKSWVSAAESSWNTRLSSGLP